MVRSNGRVEDLEGYCGRSRIDAESQDDTDKAKCIIHSPDYKKSCGGAYSAGAHKTVCRCQEAVPLVGEPPGVYNESASKSPTNQDSVVCPHDDETQQMKVATASWTSWVCLEELQSSIEGKATHEELVGKEATGQ